MIKTKTKAIGSRGFRYTVRQFGSKEGGRMLVFLGKLLGKPIGDAVGVARALDLQTVGKVITGLTEAFSEQDYDRLVDAFASHTEVSGGEYVDRSLPLNAEGFFDLHFAGEYGELVEWLMFGIEVNYSSFFEGLGGEKVKDLAAVLRVSGQAPPSPSPSRSISETIGQSGE